MKTIKSSSEITRIFEEGRHIGTPELSLIVLRNDNQHDREGRVAFIAGKKLGNAVWRNRAKRRMRGAFKALDCTFDGYDVVFLARRNVVESPFDALVGSMDKALRRARLKDE